MRKGQIIYNFIEWLKTKGVEDIFYMSNTDWEKYMAEYKKLLKIKS